MIDVRVIDVHGKHSVVGPTIWIRHLFAVWAGPPTFIVSSLKINIIGSSLKKLFATPISYCILVYVQQYL